MDSKKAQVKSGRAKYYSDLWAPGQFNCIWEVLGDKAFYLTYKGWETSVFTSESMLTLRYVKRVPWSFVRKHVHFH